MKLKNVDDFSLYYESVDRSFERGQTFHNFNDHDYMVLEALSPRNLVVMDMKVRFSYNRPWCDRV